MVIDIHTHTFPDKIANKVIRNLEEGARAISYSDGTDSGLLSSMKKNGVDISILQPVATKEGQAHSINSRVDEYEGPIYSFGAIHPDDSDYIQILQSLAADGIKGIKLHPVYQQCDIDDIKNERIIYKANELGLYVLYHAGLDVAFPGQDQASVDKTLNMLNDVRPDKVILAHMGGWQMWDEFLQKIAGMDVYIDTAVSLRKIIPLPGSTRRDDEDIPMSIDTFYEIVRIHGADKILFGSDSPWDDSKELIDYIKNTALSDEEKAAILYLNAKKILGL